MLHPVLFAAAYVLSIALANEVEPAGIVRPLAVAAALALAVTLIGWAVFRDRWDGGLCATTMLLFLATPVPAYWAWRVLEPRFGAMGAILVAAAALTLIIGGPAVLALRSKRGGRSFPRPSTGALNAFAAILVAVVYATSAIPHLISAGGQLTAAETPVHVPAQSGTPHDIVIILLDGYPRADVLDRRLGIDNSEFLEGLRGRGFDVASASHSNYVFTGPTLASLFQMRYLDQVDRLRPLIGTTGPHHDALRDAASDGPALAVLRAAGYRIVMAPPDWEHAKLRSAADRVFEHGLTDLERMLLERTWLLDFIAVLAPNVFTDQQRDLIVGQFDDLDAFASASRDEPAFLFVHVPAPHAPLVVDATGEALQLDSRQFGANTAEELGVARPVYETLYDNEIAYLNRRVLVAVDALLASDTQPVIVVMSDHGYTQEPRDDDPQARFANLFAAFTPDAPRLMANNPTPVNLMPRLLNKYLGSSVPESEDRFFLSLSEYQPLLLQEVADPDSGTTR